MSPRASAAALRSGLCGALVLLVLLVDIVLARLPWHIGTGAVLDWTGHLATSALGLLAAQRLGLHLRPKVAAVVLASSVLIDMDHVPLYLGVPHVAGAGGRPVTHSLATVALLLVAAALTRRPLLLAVVAGVLLHFVRDVATGGGLPLLWPLEVVAKAPYPAYLGVITALAAVASVTQRESVTLVTPVPR